uniref:Uncharacterized protein n=1 Tax=Oryza nivara TaxID=4536 RepID=A0A0E0HHV9_ORYNI
MDRVARLIDIRHSKNIGQPSTSKPHPRTKIGTTGMQGGGEEGSGVRRRRVGAVGGGDIDVWGDWRVDPVYGSPRSVEERGLCGVQKMMTITSMAPSTRLPPAACRYQDCQITFQSPRGNDTSTTAQRPAAGVRRRTREQPSELSAPTYIVVSSSDTAATCIRLRSHQGCAASYAPILMAVSRACPAMPPETRLQQRAWLPCAGHNVLSARRKSCRGWAAAHLLRRQPRRPRPLPGIAEAGGRVAAGNIKARSFFFVCLSAWPEPITSMTIVKEASPKPILPPFPGSTRLVLVVHLKSSIPLQRDTIHAPSETTQINNDTQ